MSTQTRPDYAARLKALRAETRARRASRPPCICEPGDPCDYHAALGIGSVANAQEKSER